MKHKYMNIIFKQQQVLFVFTGQTHENYPEDTHLHHTEKHLDGFPKAIR
jgi:hypothetical protein